MRVLKQAFRTYLNPRHICKQLKGGLPQLLTSDGSSLVIGANCCAITKDAVAEGESDATVLVREMS